MTEEAIPVEEPKAAQQFPCKQCGAKLVFKPCSQTQKCEYCGFENPIPQSEADIVENDFAAQLAALPDKEETCEVLTVKCAACGVDVSLQMNVTADLCPFCGSNIVAEGSSKKQLRPQSLLPFKITNNQALEEFRKWVAGLWFAPNALKKFAQADKGLQGVYVPYWTYDSDTTSFYRGERGDDYWATEHYTTTVNGKTVSKTRQVRRTRWRSVSGTVWNRFDDVLVPATRSLPQKYVEELEPWDLKNLTPYNEQYVGGFRAESYSVTLPEGFARAKEIMEVKIRASVCRDIGGDHQRIHVLKSRHDNITFKHLMLPIWLSSYRYKEKVFRFLVNGRTGEVQGERPYSWIKILLAAVAAVGVIAGIAALLGNG
jgi:predicted RNA-binding Zn-ribbon protein involved in translation (DUF1610 family)